MKKCRWMTLAIFGLFLTAMLACGSGGGKYGEVKKTMGSVSKVMENLAKEMDQAEDAKAVASVLNKLADELKIIQPKMEKLFEKYPELQNPENLPSDVKEILDKVENFERDKLASMHMKAKKFSGDPDVAKAMQKIQETMK